MSRFRTCRSLGIGTGLSDFALDLRLRYKIKPEFAPYIGVSWTRKVGDSADFARTAAKNGGSVAL